MTVASVVILILLGGCATVSPIERDLQTKVPFCVSQMLLRDVIAGLDKEVKTQIRIDPRLNEVADLCINHLPKTEATSQVPLGVALDIIRMQTVYQYKANVDWKVEGDHILLFFAGSDEDYKALKKRD